MAVNLVNVEVDARRGAEEEVARLLAAPSDLKRLQSFREDQATKQRVMRRQLSATISSQVESIRSGLELLDSAQKAVLKMKAAFAQIDELCAACNAVIQHHDKIQVLAAVHYNISKTLQYAQYIAELPEQAKEAELMLEDDSQLLQVYEVLSVLECTSIKAQQALEAGARCSVQDSQNLNNYFKQVRASFNRFEERLWSIIRNFMAVAQSAPWLLTNAVRVVETQQRVDAQLKSAIEVGVDPVIKPRHYRRRCEQQIAMSLDEKFAPLAQRCSTLAGEAENTYERVSQILAEADQYVAELPIIFDAVAPCFPPHYAIFDVIRREYQKQIASMLDFIGVCADNLTYSDILEVIGWVERYLTTLENLGLDEKDAALPNGPQNGMPLLIGKNMERTRGTITKWYTNILKDDMEQEPKEYADGKAYTPGVTDFFRILNEQLSLLEPVSRGHFLLRMTEVLLETMRDYQALQTEYLDALAMVDENDVFLTCAVVNNMSRCFVLSLDFKDDINNMLADEYKGQLTMDREMQGFIALAGHGMARMVDGMFTVEAFADLFKQLYCTDAWYERSVTSSVLATLEDYFFANTGYWLDKRNFEFLCELTLDKTVLHYTAAALHVVKAVDDDLVAGMQADITDIDEFFSAYVKPDLVAIRIQQLVDLRALMAADSGDALMLSYTSLLQGCPGITPAMIERLVYVRKDLGKAEMREIVEGCRHVYIDRQRALPPEDAAKLKPTGRQTGFERALVAARRVGVVAMQA